MSLFQLQPRELYRSRLRPVVIAAALLSIPFLLLGFNYLVSNEFDDIRVLRREVDNSVKLRASLDDILSLHQDLETGTRGYLITMDPRFLGPFDHARQGIPLSLEAFEGSDESGRYADEVPRLQANSRAQVTLAQETVDLVRNGQAERARQIVTEGRGKYLMDQMRSMIARIDSEEEVHLAETTRVRDLSRARLEDTIRVLQIVLALLLAIVAAFTGRTIRQRQRALARVQDLNERQKAMFDGAVDGMLLLDRNGYIVDANASIARMFGREKSSFIGQHNSVLIANRPPLEVSQAWLREVGPAGSSGAGKRQEFIGARADGSTFNTETAISMFQDGGQTFYIAVIRDITEYKRIEALKTEFVSTVSHELRTPLTSIGGSLGLLASGAVGKLGDKAERLVSIAHNNCERLVRLINDILDIEKMESGSMAFDKRRMQLAPLVQRTVAANTGFAERHDIRIVSHVPPWPQCINGDPDRLEQLLTNLLSNAIKHSPVGEEVEIWCEQRGGMARLEVRDRGGGIPLDFRDKIFGKFAMADSSDSRARGGTGLGLSIVQEIAQRHDGTVGFEDRKGGGTVFYVDLPLLQEEGVTMPRMVPDLPVILHVDDDDDCLSVVASAFDGLATVIAAGSRNQASYVLETKPVSAVIIDVGLSGENGLDLIPIVHKADPTIPVALFTALDDSYSWANLDAVMVKSRTPLDELVETVMGLIARRCRSDAA